LCAIRKMFGLDIGCQLLLAAEVVAVLMITVHRSVEA
jgi:hypothetical protein